MKTITTIINDIEEDEEDEELVFPVLMYNLNSEQVWKFEGKYSAICMYVPHANGSIYVGKVYCFNTPCTNKDVWRKFKGKIVTTMSN